MEARIAAALGNPARDPHGDLIPSAELVMPPDELTPLSALRPPQTAEIVRVHSEDAALLRHLESLGLVPGARLQVTGFSAYDGNLTLRSGETVTVLGPAITRRVFVNIL
jgi:DtxR family Mn-dependent transcriptional regulator